MKTIRSSSMFGMSFIYIIFDDDIEFYWSRSRILEAELPASGNLAGRRTAYLGTDATALGQIYWYTLEGRDPKTGKPTGGWNAEELRTIQDFYVKYTLSSAEGIRGCLGGRFREGVPDRVEPGCHVRLQRLRDGYHERHQEEQPRYRRRDDGDQQGGVPDPGLGVYQECKRYRECRHHRSGRRTGSHIGRGVREYRPRNPTGRAGQGGCGGRGRSGRSPLWLQPLGGYQ